MKNPANPNIDNAYRQILEDELKKRQDRKATYSLRSFARLLHISPAMLSQILLGKRKLTINAALKIAEHLPLSESDKRKFLDSVDGRFLNQLESKVNSQFTQFNPETFRAISDPVHLEILALGDISERRWTAEWIAKRLGTTKSKALNAMKRLESLNLVEVSGESFKSSNKSMRIRSPKKDLAIQDYHRKCLKKASASLEKPVDQREFNTITMAVDSTKLDAARELTNRFLENIHSLLDSMDRKDRIYNISVQIYPACVGPSREPKKRP